VTNLNNNKQVIVRINDRGPFHSNRIIDLSYTAALKLGYLGKGSGLLEVERLLPEEIARLTSGKAQQTDVAKADVPSQPNVTAKTENIENAIAAFGNPQPDTLPTSRIVVTSAAPAPGFYVQLGAYGQASNAEAMRLRLMQNWSSTMPPIEVAQSGALHRLQSGPFATRAEAAAAALQLQNASDAKPMIVQR
jgi:rare lipoprotein A